MSYRSTVLSTNYIAYYDSIIHTTTKTLSRTPTSQHQSFSHRRCQKARDRNAERRYRVCAEKHTSSLLGTWKVQATLEKRKAVHTSVDIVLRHTLEHAKPNSLPTPPSYLLIYYHNFSLTTIIPLRHRSSNPCASPEDLLLYIKKP